MKRAPCACLVRCRIPRALLYTARGYRRGSVHRGVPRCPSEYHRRGPRRRAPRSVPSRRQGSSHLRRTLSCHPQPHTSRATGQACQWRHVRASPAASSTRRPAARPTRRLSGDRRWICCHSLPPTRPARDGPISTESRVPLPLASSGHKRSSSNLGTRPQPQACRAALPIPPPLLGLPYRIARKAAPLGPPRAEN